MQMANNRNPIMFELAQVKTLDMEYAMQIIIMAKLALSVHWEIRTSYSCSAHNFFRMQGTGFIWPSACMRRDVTVVSVCPCVCVCVYATYCYHIQNKPQCEARGGGGGRGVIQLKNPKSSKTAQVFRNRALQLQLHYVPMATPIIGHNYVYQVPNNTRGGMSMRT